MIISGRDGALLFGPDNSFCSSKEHAEQHIEVNKYSKSVSVNLPPFEKTMTHRPISVQQTNPPTDQQMDIRGHTGKKLHLI